MNAVLGLKVKHFVSDLAEQLAGLWSRQCYECSAGTETVTVTQLNRPGL